MLIVTP